MKKINFLIALGLLIFASACTIEDQVDPNGPSLNSVAENASITQLNLLVTGIEARMRNGFGTYATASGTIARELYVFDADPRNTEDLLGKVDEDTGANISLDNNTFYLTNPYVNAYRTIKNCNILLAALDNTSSVTETEKSGYRGFANTVKGLMYLRVLDMLHDNGIRFDVADPDNLGEFLTKSSAYSAINGLLDEALGQINGSEFIFPLSTGFAGYDTPATFASVNRAIAARVAIHGEDYGRALSVVANSFVDDMGALNEGPKHIFSTVGTDILNPLFKSPGQSGDQIIVNPDVIADLRDGDTRMDKFGERVSATSQDNLNGDFETRLYASATAPIDLIRNEELLLIRAEANIQAGTLDAAVSDLNVIRNAYGLGDYMGAMDKGALTDELLYQRRYSLWGEGHRMWDLRRYGRLTADFVPIDRDGDLVYTQFPIPLSENQ